VGVVCLFGPYIVHKTDVNECAGRLQDVVMVNVDSLQRGMPYWRGRVRTTASYRPELWMCFNVEGALSALVQFILYVPFSVHAQSVQYPASKDE
jgi:hypothetical protein